MKKIFFKILLLLMFVENSYADKITAVCEEPSGWMISNVKGKEEARDGIKGAVTTYSWKTGNKKALVVTQNTALVGGQPMSFDADVISISKRQISFLIRHNNGIELDSLFLDTGDLYLSTHKSWGAGSLLDEKASKGEMFKAKCKIGSN